LLKPLLQNICGSKCSKKKWIIGLVYVYLIIRIPTPNFFSISIMMNIANEMLEIVTINAAQILTVNKF